MIELLARYILENVSVNKDSFIADFGCGDGRQ
jgi:16S rRNA G1207 methylase RsmC